MAFWMAGEVACAQNMFVCFVSWMLACVQARRVDTADWKRKH